MGDGVLMSRVNYKKCQCCVSLSQRNSHVPCRIDEMSMSLSLFWSRCVTKATCQMSNSKCLCHSVAKGLMLHDKFKKWMCRRVNFRGLEPLYGE